MIGLTPYPELCHPFGVIKNHSKKKYLKSGCVQALHKCFLFFAIALLEAIYSSIRAT